MTKTVFEGDHVLVLERDDWQFVERKKGKTAVAIVAVTDDRELVLTEQFRHPVNARVVDLPAGLVGDEAGSENRERTARKELMEETGHSCDSVEHLATGPSSPGITSELVSLYRARGVRKTGQGGGVGGEDITVHLVPLDAVAAWLKAKAEQGILIDLKIWSALCFLSKRT